MTRYIFILSVFLFILNCSDKKNNDPHTADSQSGKMTISGTIDSDTVKTLYIFNYDNLNEAYDSIKVINKKFHYTENTPPDLKIISNRPNYEQGIINVYFVSEPGNINININSTHNNKHIIKGGKLNDILARYEQQSDAYSKQEDSLYNLLRINQFSSTAAQQEAEKSYNDLIKKRDQDLRQFAKDNYDNVLSFIAVMEASPQIQKDLWNHINPKLLNTKIGIAIKESLKMEANAAATQDEFPNATLITTSGQTIQMRELLNPKKYLFIDFWASWCMPCRVEIPELQKLYQKYKHENIEFTSISLDEKQADWKKALQADKPGWSQYIVDETNSTSLSNYWGIQTIPYGILISPDGKTLIKGMTNAGEVEEAIQKIVLKK